MKFTWKKIAALRIFVTALSLVMLIMEALHKSRSAIFNGAFILFVIASITTSYGQKMIGLDSPKAVRDFWKQHPFVSACNLFMIVCLIVVGVLWIQAESALLA
ncbi:hypothetical protein [Oscillibacter sp.]|uniref:hypothetical protein n=1 Tax=Oscillibacter sp. TaxID=1945593 RepID=UPI0033928506